MVEMGGLEPPTPYMRNKFALTPIDRDRLRCSKQNTDFLRKKRGILQYFGSVF